ncbi:MAG TPA: Hsp33 family molecular chaperone HslO [Blastocatellia bacterium]|nr:Hsp33 family molecular chaperone HslO [Blastocatellia bacterium]
MKLEHKQDHLILATNADAMIRLIAVVATDLVAEACDRHRTAPTASAALGRTLSGALLLGCAFKDLEYITLRFDCDGPVGGIVTEAGAGGSVRGYVKNPAAHLPPNSVGKLDVRGIVGGGMLHVIREAGFEIGLMKEPYYGSTPIVSGEIAEDIAHYLAVSEQINSVVSLGVFVESERESVTAAGGYMIQALPGAEESAIAAIEKATADAPSVTEAIRGGADAAEMLRLALKGLPFDTLESRPVEFRCKCSYERVVRIVTALGREEVEDMIEKDKGAELTCHFCNSVYYLDEDALRGILEPPPPVLM